MGQVTQTEPVLSLRTATTEDTLALGRCVGAACLPLPDAGLVLCLSGDLGVGKTVFVRGLARGIGIPAETAIVSPTFTIARSYPVPGAQIELHHVDAYRLEGAEDLDAAGFEEMCGKGCLTCVEWGERVPAALPDDRLEVTLAMDDADGAPPPEPGAIPECGRTVRLTARGPNARAVLRKLEAATQGVFD